MGELLVQFAQVHAEFRRAEVASVATITNCQLPPWTDGLPAADFLWAATWASEADAVRLTRRSTLIKTLYRIHDRAAGLDDLLVKWTASGPPPTLTGVDDATTFKFAVSAHPRHLDWASQMDAISRTMACDALPFKTKGCVSLKDAQRTFRIFLVYPDAAPESPTEAAFLLEEWMARWWRGPYQLAEGNRSMIEQFALAKRPYLGTTSMDTELAFLMANQGLVQPLPRLDPVQVHPGALVMDPFVGTGSILLPAAHFGGFCVGLEIDPRVLRGTGKPLSNNKPPRAGSRIAGSNVHTNFRQFNLEHRVDFWIADSSRLRWRADAAFDAIITDPPYGVREGARQLASRKDDDVETKAHVRRRLYEAAAILTDLLAFAVQRLTVGGRLVYWLATSRESFHPDDIPVHPALRLIAADPQHFSRWSRRLVTMEKVREPQPDDRVCIPTVDRGGVPSFETFRQDYFEPSAERALRAGADAAPKRPRKNKASQGAPTAPPSNNAASAAPADATA